MTEPSAQEQTTTTNHAPANVEVDTSFENDSSYGDELSSYNASLTSSVIDYRHENEQWFKEAGFVNIHVEKFVIPYGVWPKDPHLKKVGAWNQTQAEANGFEAAALAPLTRFKQWRKEEVIFLASKARADGRNRNIHMMFDFYVVYPSVPRTDGQYYVLLSCLDKLFV